MNSYYFKIYNITKNNNTIPILVVSDKFAFLLSPEFSDSRLQYKIKNTSYSNLSNNCYVDLENILLYNIDELEDEIGKLSLEDRLNIMSLITNKNKTINNDAEVSSIVNIGDNVKIVNREDVWNNLEGIVLDIIDEEVAVSINFPTTNGVKQIEQIFNIKEIEII